MGGAARGCGRDGVTAAHACLLGGFLLAIGGLASLSIPVACIVAGLTLFVAGGLELRRGDVPPERTTRR